MWWGIKTQQNNTNTRCQGLFHIYKTNTTAIAGKSKRVKTKRQVLVYDKYLIWKHLNRIIWCCLILQKNVRCTVFTLSIGTPYLLTILVLKFWNSPVYYLLMCINVAVCMANSRHWSDPAFCGIWSGSTLLAKAYLSQYLGLLRYIVFFYFYLLWYPYSTEKSCLYKIASQRLSNNFNEIFYVLMEKFTETYIGKTLI